LKLTIEKRKQVTKNFNDVRKDVNSKITESLNFAIEIKKNIKEQKEVTLLKRLMQGNYNKKFQEKIKFNVINSSISRIIFVITTTITLILIISEYKNGNLTAGAVLSVFTYSSSIM
jgi:ABC-type multidrug transport system fused ATPase/permease subunit